MIEMNKDWEGDVSHQNLGHVQYQTRVRRVKEAEVVGPLQMQSFLSLSCCCAHSQSGEGKQVSMSKTSMESFLRFMECQELSHMYNDNYEALATLFKEDYKVPSQVTTCSLAERSQAAEQGSLSMSPNGSAAPAGASDI